MRSDWIAGQVRVPWAEGTYDKPGKIGVRTFAAHIRGGLAIHRAPYPAAWQITHVRSGMGIIPIPALVLRGEEIAFEVGDEMQGWGEWDAFASADGWKNVIPDLLEKIAEVAEKFALGLSPAPHTDERWETTRRMVKTLRDVSGD